MTQDGANLPTVCVLCSHNCGLRVDVKDGRIVAVRGDETNPITRGYVCNKAFGTRCAAGPTARSSGSTGPRRSPRSPPG